MKASSKLGFLIAGLLLTGCATKYQAKSFTGGYSDAQLDENTFQVSFRGNGYTSRETVELYTLYRCAELTAQAGFDYFIVFKSETEARNSTITTPGTYHSTTEGSAYGRAETRGTYTPGQTIPVTRYGSSVAIKTFKGEKPENNPDAYNATELLKYLGSKIER